MWQFKSHETTGRPGETAGSRSRGAAEPGAAGCARTAHGVGWEVHAQGLLLARDEATGASKINK